jgi:hypothetical protein
MGCGCGAPKGRRQVQSMVKAPSGVLRAVATTNHRQKTAANNESIAAMTEERRKVEKLRRDAILRALGRP